MNSKLTGEYHWRKNNLIIRDYESRKYSIYDIAKKHDVPMDYVEWLIGDHLHYLSMIGKRQTQGGTHESTKNKIP